MTNESNNVKGFPDDTTDINNDYNSQVSAGCESDSIVDNSKNCNIVVKNDFNFNIVRDTTNKHADNIIILNIELQDKISKVIFYDEEAEPLLQKKRKTRPDRSEVQYITAFYCYHSHEFDK